MHVNTEVRFLEWNSAAFIDSNFIKQWKFATLQINKIANWAISQHRKPQEILGLLAFVKSTIFSVFSTDYLLFQALGYKAHLLKQKLASRLRLKNAREILCKSQQGLGLWSLARWDFSLLILSRFFSISSARTQGSKYI